MLCNWSTLPASSLYEILQTVSPLCAFGPAAKRHTECRQNRTFPTWRAQKQPIKQQQDSRGRNTCFCIRLGGYDSRKILPFWPVMKFTQSPRSICKLLWHMKFSSRILDIIPAHDLPALPRCSEETLDSSIWAVIGSNGETKEVRGGGGRSTRGRAGE